MRKHIIDFQSTLYQALQQMNCQRVKFLVAADEANRVIGTLTDGDVRRGLLRGMKLEDSIESAICKDFVSVSNAEGLHQILLAFQNSQIEFLPVLDGDRRIRNIITDRKSVV